jgi:hypothetical protein
MPAVDTKRRSSLDVPHPPNRLPLAELVWRMSGSSWNFDGDPTASAGATACRASAARLTGLGVVNLEPTVANGPETPCASQENTVVTSLSPLNSLLSLTAVTARTDATPGDNVSAGWRDRAAVRRCLGWDQRVRVDRRDPSAMCGRWFDVVSFD